jgi:hypothetical protein
MWILHFLQEPVSLTTAALSFCSKHLLNFASSGNHPVGILLNCS